MKSLNIDIDNPYQMLSHVLLNDTNLVDLVSSTEKWTKNGEISAQVIINGIEVSAESFEETLKGLFKQVEDHYAEKYDADNFDKLVEERAKEIIKEHADNALEKLQDLVYKLEESDNLIKPHWQR